MTNDELLARAEKAEKELAECRAKMEKLVGHLIQQQEESVRIMKVMLGKNQKLETQMVRIAEATMLPPHLFEVQEDF